MAKELEQQHERTEIHMSVGNLLQLPTIWSIVMPVETIVDMSRRSRYCGMEWLPNRTRSGLQMRYWSVSEESKKYIKSGHQSYRSERNIVEAWRHLVRSVALPSLFLLPHKNASLRDLERLQDKVGRELPVVLYPPANEEDESGMNRYFGLRTFQPTSDVMEYWGVRSVATFVDHSALMGYGGTEGKPFCIDTHHIRGRTKEYTFDPWEESLPILLPHTAALHVSLGRYDVKRGKSDPIDELRDIIRGTERAEITRMLQLIAKEKWSGRVDIEVPSSQLLAIRNEDHRDIDRRVLTPDEFVYYNRRITERVAELLGI